MYDGNFLSKMKDTMDIYSDSVVVDNLATRLNYFPTLPCCSIYVLSIVGDNGSSFSSDLLVR